jgi:predicted ester cyclase
MKSLKAFAAMSLVGWVGCAGQEPSATPLAASPTTTLSATAPAVAERKEASTPVPLTPDQKVKAYQDGWAAFNAKDFAKFQSIWADDATSLQFDMGPPLVGPVAIVDNGAKAFATGFPDGNGEIELTLVNGNQVFGIVLIRGTQKGPFTTPAGVVPPTGKKVGFLAAHGVEFNAAGKADKEWMAYDGGTVAAQLGLSPAPHRAALEKGWAENPVVIASGSDAEKANVAAFNKEIEAFNKHDTAGALGSAADDLVFTELTAPADRTSKKTALKGVEEMYKAFPDVKLDVKSVWDAGDYVLAVGTWSGTNTGDMPAAHLKKTGKAVSVQFIEIDQFAAGKTKHIWIFSNGAAMAAQLGLMPPPGAAKVTAKKPASAK